MTRKPRALDLFCGAGGASMGLFLAGFEVTGCDLAPQPRYPFQFAQGDAMRPPFDLRDFDLIWASPPCQRWTRHARQHRSDAAHPDYLADLRAMLAASGRPYCIENVPCAPLRVTLVLTGAMFGLTTFRRRHFETSFAVLAPPPGRAFGPKTRPGSVTISGHSGGRSLRSGWANGGRAEWCTALGIDWMTTRELAKAIPPVYAEFVGREVLRGRIGASPETAKMAGIAINPEV